MFQLTVKAQEVYFIEQRETMEQFAERLARPNEVQHILHTSSKPTILLVRYNDTANKDEWDSGAMVFYSKNTIDFVEMKFDWEFGVCSYPQTSTVDSIYISQGADDQTAKMTIWESGGTRSWSEEFGSYTEICCVRTSYMLDLKELNVEFLEDEIVESKCEEEEQNTN